MISIDEIFDGIWQLGKYLLACEWLQIVLPIILFFLCKYLKHCIMRFGESTTIDGEESFEFDDENDIAYNSDAWWKDSGYDRINSTCDWLKNGGKRY